MTASLHDIGARLLVADRLHHGEANAHDRLANLAATTGIDLINDGGFHLWSRLVVIGALGFVREHRAAYPASTGQEAASALVMRTLCYLHEAEEGKLFRDNGPAHAASGMNHRAMAAE